MGLKFDYPREFERVWQEHRFGAKYEGFKAWKKEGFDKNAEENDWLVNYLTRRHKEDVRWLEGKYVPHLSSFINQRRWEDAYQKVRTAAQVKDWSGHSPTDEENNRKFWRAAAARGEVVPEKYQHLLEVH